MGALLRSDIVVLSIEVTMTAILLAETVIFGNKLKHLRKQNKEKQEYKKENTLNKMLENNKRR